MKRRALISVYDKTGVQELATGLLALGYELVSTGGTYKTLREAGLEVTYISEVTGFPEILGGRVKTLHPKIHGGILAKRSVSAHMEELAGEGITPVDLVVVNLYPFQATIAKPDVTLDEALENIDIGGPTMIRAAAKNFPGVIVLVNPGNYQSVLDKLRSQGDLDFDDRLALAQEAFAHTAGYDAAIQEYLWKEQAEGGFPQRLILSYERAMDLRYGENPHQKAVFYRDAREQRSGLLAAKQLHGKELSFNNINDANAALELLAEFSEPAAVCLKHTNPCGVAVGKDMLEAYTRAYEGDPVSIFGGIVALNREVDRATAEKLHEIFLEIILAPKFSPEALEVLTSKKNIRLLEVDLARCEAQTDYKKVVGGLLVQEADNALLSEQDLRAVTDRKPSPRELADLLFAWKVVKHVKSNAIVVAKNGRTLGVGAGQMNRIDPTHYALNAAGNEVQGAVLASDAFFPMPDVVQACAKKGITAIIQPGGSIRDEDSIVEAKQAGIAMIFTGMRHFKH